MKPLLTDCTATLRLLYDRGKDGYGVPVPGTRFPGTQRLLHALLAVQQDLRQIGWWPHIENFLTAGLYVDKKGAHGDGIAWDFDGVVLKPNPLDEQGKGRILVYESSHFWGYEHKMSSLSERIKTRFACLLSLRFGVVLGDYYNKAHADHIHADLSRPVKWRGSRSQVVLLQETLSAWFNAGLKVDGVNGEKTMDAWGNAFYGLNMKPTSTWLAWLKMIAFNPPKDVK